MEGNVLELKRWKIAQSDLSLAEQIAKTLKVDPLVCDVLLGRGYENEEQIQRFLEGSPTFFDPFLMKDMDKAVARIQLAVENGEKIAVYGDYDCDGMTATYLVYTYLENIGADVFFYIPDRDGEGYGLNKGAIDRISQQGTTLIITVDNGISALDEVKYAAELGVDVVITDHHQPLEALPKAVAVVDPHRVDCESPYKNLAGVGVAFKLLCALDGDDGWGHWNHWRRSQFGWRKPPSRQGRFKHTKNDGKYRGKRPAVRGRPGWKAGEQRNGCFRYCAEDQCCRQVGQDIQGAGTFAL